MKEHHIEIPRSARYFTLGEVGPATRQVWIVCHGYGQLAAQFLRYFRFLDDGTRMVVAPEGISRFYHMKTSGSVGASWMTKEDRAAEISDYVRYLRALHDHIFGQISRESVELHLFGFSQGTATVCRWIERDTVVPERLTLWGGLIPPDIDLSVFKEKTARTDFTIVVGDEDEYAEPELVSAQEMRLRESEIVHSLIRFAGGHRLDRKVLTALG
ncbi:MAG: phospholipase [Gemmatimonadota bacterium]|nr:MAG: phospholipase [Gemmatimonadota bacterium]